MKLINKILLSILLAFIAIQFFHPARNRKGQLLPTDFTKIYTVPGNIKTILLNACYDCHSNNTRYPWYSNIQPMAWMMARHIKNGKEKVNFSEFGNYNARRQITKLKGIANSLNDDIMPLISYKIMHKNARLSKADISFVIEWMQNKADSLSNNYH